MSMEICLFRHSLRIFPHHIKSNVRGNKQIVRCYIRGEVLDFMCLNVGERLIFQEVSKVDDSTSVSKWHKS